MVKGRWNQRKEVFEKEISTQTARKSRNGQRNPHQEKSNLYPNGQEKQKRVEKFTTGKIKSLPKQLERRIKVDNPTPAHKNLYPSEQNRQKRQNHHNRITKFPSQAAEKRKKIAWCHGHHAGNKGLLKSPFFTSALF